MKTDKFEKTIRQKLESISPDFHEEDWTKMQNYMQVHTPPTFWQQYGSWLGYAAAASVSVVMAFLYVNQLSQNNMLVSDVKKLQNQIEVIKSSPTTIQKTDTVYIVQKELTRDQFLNVEPQNYPVANSESAATESTEPEQTENIDQDNATDRADVLRAIEKPVYAENKAVNSPEPSDRVKEKSESEAESRNIASNNTTNISSETAVSKDNRESKFLSGKSYGNIAGSNPLPNLHNGSKQFESGSVNDGLTPATPVFSKTLDDHFSNISEIQTARIINSSRQMNYALLSRLAPRQVKKVLLASTPVIPVDDKKVEKTTKAENTIPRLNLKVPYRFGGGIQFEGKNQVKTVVGEVLVSKKFSVSAGVSWMKIKPMEFFTAKIFREKNRQDFQKSHPKEVPMAFEILNIKIKPTLVQIPLTVAFRNEIKNNFSYFISTGTNITVKGNESFSFDCRVPNQKSEFLNKSFERKMDIPVINSLNFSAGIEKDWHPIVIQIEGYAYTYFQQLSPESARTGPGVKLKLLYQIGGKMQAK